LNPTTKFDRILLFDGSGRFMAGDANAAKRGAPVAALCDLLGEEQAARILAERADATLLATAHGDVALRWLVGGTGPLMMATVHASPREAIGHRDALTGLPDRREIASWFAERERRGAGRPYAVLFLDLDDFKTVNDRHGHAGGDAALAELARRWTAAVRDGDLVVRYGGDEFLVLLENAVDANAVQSVVERLDRATRQAIDLNGTPLALTATIGVAVGAHGEPVEERILAADQAMYAQKRQRRK
jgi:diguanylate cyclase (GGDEF)-like protein